MRFNAGLSVEEIEAYQQILERHGFDPAHFGIEALGEGRDRRLVIRNSVGSLTVNTFVGHRWKDVLADALRRKTFG